jgi:hypothetical protein
MGFTLGLCWDRAVAIDILLPFKPAFSVTDPDPIRSVDPDLDPEGQK